MFGKRENLIEKKLGKGKIGKKGKFKKK